MRECSPPACVTCHLSCDTCHVSHVICHVSHATFCFLHIIIILLLLYSQWVEGLLSTGPTLSSFASTTSINHRSIQVTRVIANAIFKLQTPINDKICKIAFGNISWNESYWHDCSLLFFVMVIAKAITHQRRFQDFFLTNFVGILLRLGYQPATDH